MQIFIILSKGMWNTSIFYLFANQTCHAQVLHMYTPYWSWLADLGWSQSIQDLSMTSMFWTPQ